MALEVYLLTDHKDPDMSRVPPLTWSASFQKCISSWLSSVFFHGSPPFLHFILSCLTTSIHLFPFLPCASSHVSPRRHPPVSPFVSHPQRLPLFPQVFLQRCPVLLCLAEALARSGSFSSLSQLWLELPGTGTGQITASSRTGHHGSPLLLNPCSLCPIHHCSSILLPDVF